MSFDEVKGQGRAAEVLRQGIAKDRLPHALLFLGAEGSGRFRMAQELAKALFCEKPSPAGGCGACGPCSQVSRETHPDLFKLEREEGSEQIKIEAVREMIARVALRPFVASSKVFVVRGAERLNEVSQNALLKTLEEPQGRSVFVLCASSADGLLPTLRSRLQSVSFAPPDTEGEPGTKAEILRRRLLDFVRAADTAAARGDAPADPMALAPDLSKEERGDVLRALEYLAGWYRDVLILKEGAGEVLTAGREDLPDKERWAAHFTEDALLDRIERFSRAKERVAANVSVRTALASLWDELAGRTTDLTRHV